jgi:pyrroloquinoline quinone biosynthesis protein B
VRDGSIDARPRTQSSVCVSRDGRRWALLNASPDVRSQILAFPALAPPPETARGSGIAAVVLTNADIDHSAGLLILREGGAPPIYATERVQAALTDGLSILRVLRAFGPVDVRTLAPGGTFRLCDRGGDPIGVRGEAFAVASKAPPYVTGGAAAVGEGERAGDTIGLLLRDEAGEASEPGRAGVLAYVPGVRALDEALRAQLAQADVILIDGTFYTDDELIAPGLSRKTARMMGHAPITGPDGLLAFLEGFPRARRILLHVNNTNPILDERSDARRALSERGLEVAHDGLELVV